MKAVMDRAEAEGRDLSGEEVATYNTAEADMDRLDEAIQRGDRYAARASQMDQMDHSHLPPKGFAGGMADDEADPDDAAYGKVFNSYLRGGQDVLDADQRKTLHAAFRTDKDVRMAAGVGTGAAGGFAVPLEFRNELIETLKWYGPMLQIAQVVESDSGVNWPWPTNDDTANVGAILAENTQVTEQDVTFGTASLGAYMYTSKLVRASVQFMQDVPNASSWLAKALGVRLGRILNQHFTTGTGTNQPLGIVPGSPVGATGTGSFASTGGLSYDNLIDLQESLDPAYQRAGRCGWLLHQSARKSIRKLKDSQNRPLWEPSVQAGTPDLLLGLPVTLNNDMAPLAASAKSIGYGDVETAYVIRLVTGVTTLRLTERYADFLQVGFLGFQRADGTVQNPNAFKVFQATATA